LLATGLLFNAEKAALHLEGGNQEFYRLKNTVKNHVTLAGAGSQLHLQAPQVTNFCMYENVFFRQHELMCT
jgi:hypothetical protein